jgi:hypothetical protein
LSAVAWSAGSTIPFSESGTVFPNPGGSPGSSAAQIPRQLSMRPVPFNFAAPYWDG